MTTINHFKSKGENFCLVEFGAVHFNLMLFCYRFFQISAEERIGGLQHTLAEAANEQTKYSSIITHKFVAILRGIIKEKFCFCCFLGEKKGIFLSKIIKKVSESFFL